MIVTGVEPCTKTKFKIFIDGKFAFVLYKGELSRFHVKEGEELSGDTKEKILREVILKRAKLRAMHLLEDMDRTEAALRQKLHTGLYPEEIVDEAIRYVRSFGYLDDARYAENYVRSHGSTKSRKELQAALLKKGVDPELTGRALENCYGETGGEEEAVRRILKKKKFNPMDADEKEISRLYGYLARKGFRYDCVRQVIQNYEYDA